ncbi:MAG: HIT domain-containing protein [Gammaproteobacteria bacterium]|jgi:diadenosine tetraphosphate (Ap4A) HIT family hydrolase
MRLHGQLARDTHRLGHIEDTIVLLHRNASVPWFILVPATEETEFLTLPDDLRTRVLEESAQTGAFVQQYFGSPKINFAAIGNIVPQLHLHVVGRDPADCCWPNPVWGHLHDVANYTTAELAAIASAMTTHCALHPAD